MSQLKMSFLGSLNEGIAVPSKKGCVEHCSEPPEIVGSKNLFKSHFHNPPMAAVPKSEEINSVPAVEGRNEKQEAAYQPTQNWQI